MKLFKRIYYPVMAGLLVLMLVLGIVDAHAGVSGKVGNAQVESAYGYATSIANVGTHNSYISGNQNNVRDQIIDALVNAGAERVSTNETDDDGNNVVDYFTEYEGAPKPTLYVQRATVKQASQVNGESEVVVNREVQNIILAVPGNKSDAILLHARYDSSAIGGASDATAVGALMESARDSLINFATGKNENAVVYLFSDAGQEGDLGAAAFMHQFGGYFIGGEKQWGVENIKAVADFRVSGTKGTLMTYAENEGSLKLIGKYSRLNGGAFSSSALSLLMSKSDYKDSGVFGDYNAITFNNRGGFNRYGTATDTTVNRKLIKQQLSAMNKFVGTFSSTDLNKLDSKSNAVYFSYLDIMTVYYPFAVSFVFGGLLLGLIVAIIVLNQRKKAFSWGRALAGAAVQLIALLAAALSSLALFYLLALLLSGFGVVPVHSLSTVVFAGTGTLIAASFLAIALTVFFYIVLKRAFAVKAADVVRGNALIFGLVAAVLAFAAPAISYPFTCTALFALTAMLMTVLFKDKFKKKFSMDIERLFLYGWSIVFSLPLYMPLIYAAQTLFPAVSIVLALAVLIALSGFIAPYADYLRPVIDKVFKKLPMRTVRYERTVTEKVEDKAKKGKFTEVTTKKIVSEKEPWNYRNRMGISAVAILAVVFVLIFSSLSTTYSSSAVYNAGYYDAIYDDALLFVYEKNSSSEAETSIEVHDQSAYNYIRYAINDMKWNADKKAYVKDYTASSESVLPNIVNYDFSKTGNTIKFKVFDPSNSQVTVRLKNAENVATVVFNEEDENRKSEEYTFSNQSEIIFRLPYGYDYGYEDSMAYFTLTLKNSDGNTVSCDVEFEQHVHNDTNLQGKDGSDWDSLYEYYLANKDVGGALKGGIVIKMTKSL